MSSLSWQVVLCFGCMIVIGFCGLVVLLDYHYSKEARARRAWRRKAKAMRIARAELARFASQPTPKISRAFIRSFRK